MIRAAAFFRWLGTPVRATRALFPFTHDGRQTLIYLMCAGSAPVLTLLVTHILETQAEAGQWEAHREIARIVAYSLLIAVCAFSMFVAFRSLSLGSKEGLLSLRGKESDDEPTPVEAARVVETEVKEAAAKAVEKVEAAVPESAPAYTGPDLSATPDSDAPKEPQWPR